MKNCVFFRLMLACKWVHNATSTLACGLNTNKTITFQMPTLKNDNSKLVSGDIEEQTHQVMKNLIDVLEAAGSSLDKVIFSRVYLVNFADFDKMNKVYASYFPSDKLPSRTCIGVTGLAVGASVEIDFIAGC